MKMSNIDFAKKLTENVCFTNSWDFDWDGIEPLIGIEMEEKGIKLHHVAGPVSIKNITDIVIEWEANTQQNYHEEMKFHKMLDYPGQNKIYTIQTDEGDRGWIQWIDEKCVEHEEVQGHVSEVNPDFFHIYRVISKEEYEIILHLWQLFHETGNSDYHAMIEQMIDLTLEKNAKFKF